MILPFYLLKLRFFIHIDKKKYAQVYRLYRILGVAFSNTGCTNHLGERPQARSLTQHGQLGHRGQCIWQCLGPQDQCRKIATGLI
jgi:hypothetical protein